MLPLRFRKYQCRGHILVLYMPSYYIQIFGVTILSSSPQLFLMHTSDKYMSSAQHHWSPGMSTAASRYNLTHSISITLFFSSFRPWDFWHPSMRHLHTWPSIHTCVYMEVQRHLFLGRGEPYIQASLFCPSATYKAYSTRLRRASLWESSPTVFSSDQLSRMVHAASMSFSASLFGAPFPVVWDPCLKLSICMASSCLRLCFPGDPGLSQTPAAADPRCTCVPLGAAPKTSVQTDSNQSQACQSLQPF